MTATILPMHRNSCRYCVGHGYRNGRPCIECAGSGVKDATAAMHEHYAYAWGKRDHARGAAREESPFARGSFPDRCWRCGWLIAERDDIARSHREKAEAERAHG